MNAQEKLEAIKKKHSSCKIKKFDISEHSRIENFIEDASLELGGLDILIYNAGVNVDNLSLRMKNEEWKKTFVKENPAEGHNPSFSFWRYERKIS